MKPNDIFHDSLDIIHSILIRTLVLAKTKNPFQTRMQAFILYFTV